MGRSEILGSRGCEKEDEMALMTEAVRTSETSVYLNETTRCYITESVHLQNITYLIVLLPYLCKVTYVRNFPLI